MRILHLIRSVDPSGGGPIEGVKQLSLKAIHSGHSVEVCSLDSPDSPYAADFPLPLHPMGPARTKYGYSNRLVPFLTERTNTFDIVVVNGIWQYHSFAAWRSLRQTRIPYVVFTHGMLDPWFKRAHPLKHLKKWLYWPWGEYRVLRDAAAVLFTTEEERFSARESFWLYQANEVVVNYGTEAPSGGYQTQLDAFFSRFPHLQNKRICLFLGRIHPKKGCDLALQAFARILANNPDWHLVFVGPDQIGWRAALSNLANRLNISDRITWAGMLSGDLKWGALRASEIFLLPSHQENFGIAVAEALACGLPTLISNKVNIWREVQFAGAGLIESDDVKGTIALLASWLQMDDSQRLAMRQNAIRCFRQHFEIESARRSLYSVLQSQVNKASDLVHAHA